MYRDSRQGTPAGNGSYTYGLSSTLLSAAGSGFSILSSSLASANKALTAGAHQLAAAGELPKGDRERVEFIKFAWLQCDAHATALKRQRRLALLVGYQTGFQLWDVQDGSKMEELVSRRDGPVRALELVPPPKHPYSKEDVLCGQGPLLAVVPVNDSAYHSTSDLPAASETEQFSSHAASQRSSCDDGTGCLREPATEDATAEPPTMHRASGRVHLYSLRNQAYVYSLKFNSRVLGLRCSTRLLVVALDAQLHAFDATSLSHVFSAVTYPAPCTHQLYQSETCAQGTAVALALGSRWLAFASNQVVESAAGQAVGQAVDGRGQGRVPGSSDPMGTGEVMSHLVQQYASQGGKQLKVIGKAGWGYLQSQWQARAGAAGSQSPTSSSSTPQLTPRSSAAGGPTSESAEADVAGTVMIRDVVARTIVAHFRAHESPLLMLEFDPSGTLLVTTSIRGHNINIWQVQPPTGSQGSQGNQPGTPGRAVHLYRLKRGLTDASIRSLAFSGDGEWLCASSSRGTSHLYHLQAPAAAAGGLAASTAQLGGPHLWAATASAAGPHHKHEVRDPAGRVYLRGSSKPPTAAASLTTAAAAAAQRVIGSTGIAIATAFHGGASSAADPQGPGPPSLHQGMRGGSGWGHQQQHLEDLYVMAAEGKLTRYRLSSPQLGAPVSSPDLLGTPTQSAASPRKEGAHQRTVAAEPVEQWDLIRRRHQREREEVWAEDEEAESSSSNQQLAWQADERQRWAANAEAASMPRGQLPLWADPQFHILQMQPDAALLPTMHLGSEATDGEIAGMASEPAPILQVEQLPVRRVDAPSGSFGPLLPAATESAALQHWTGGASKWGKAAPATPAYSPAGLSRASSARSASSHASTAASSATSPLRSLRP
ncbi:hypothetical protein WJX74_000354 [Apatococcus lobatus]|uniref:BCAS3 WD40 domain-containing protein n=1 Tax=Apatococcus lobatus TaxID=904363 RepID=A0AAW1RK78_9CHLO